MQVGSALELAQRLDEPVDLNSTMHIFDIRRSKPVFDVWRAFEQRTRARQTVKSPVSPHKESSGCTEDPRQRWLRACNPPQIRPSNTEKPLYEPQNPLAIESKNLSNLDLSDDGSKSITAEGKKQVSDQGVHGGHSNWQATEAGRRLGEALSYPPLRPSLTPVTAPNPWASYYRTQSFDSFSEKKPEAPVPSEQPPLLATFEAELGGLLSEQAEAEKQKAKDEAEEQDPEISQPEYVPPGQPQPLLPMDALFGAARSVFSDLQSRFPEVCRRLVTAQHQIPPAIENATRAAVGHLSAAQQRIHPIVENTTRTAASHLDTVASGMQTAANVSEKAAEKTRGANLNGVEQVVADGLRHLNQNDLDSFGKTLFASFQQHLSGIQPTDETTSDRHTLFIGNVPCEVNESEISNILLEKGFVGKISFPRVQPDTSHCGFAYVHFPTKFAAAGALQALQGTSLGGQMINVEFAQDAPQTERSVPVPTADAIPQPAEAVPAPELQVTGQPEVPLRNSFPSRQSSTPAPLGLPQTELRSRTDQPPTVPPKNYAEPRKENVMAISSLMDTDNPGPDFSARFPSLMNSAPTQSSRPGQQGQQNKSNQPIAPSRMFSPGLAMERYPSISQLEGMPTADAVSSLRASETHQAPTTLRRSRTTLERKPRRAHEIRDSRDSRDVLRDVHDVHSALREQRMVARELAGKGTVRDAQNSQNAGDHKESRDARVAREIDASSSTPLETYASLRRSMTERRHGHGSHGHPEPPVRHSRSLRLPRSAPRTQSVQFAPVTEGLFPSRETAPTPQRPSWPPSRASVRAPVAAPAASSGFPGPLGRPTQSSWPSRTPVDQCISHLRTLGFGGSNEADSRLRVYAEASNAVLADAIEMIEEERRAYEQRPGLL